VQKKVFSISNFFRHKVSSQINWVKSKTQIFPHCDNHSSLSKKVLYYWFLPGIVHS
jgi:hypothetical protein